MSSPAPQLFLRRRDLHLVPGRAVRASPLALWHLLSLDAPTVAALWTWTIARAAGASLAWSTPAAMFVAVWILYAADRLLDARGYSKFELEERHHFHHRHRRGFLVASSVAAVGLAALLHTLPTATLHLFTLLAALLAGWLLLVHGRALPAPDRLPKELAVGLFFPAAVFIPTVAESPGLRLWMAGPAVLFALICTMNCLFVYAWEHPGNRTHAHWTTRWATRHLRGICVGSIAASVGCAIAFRWPALSIATAISSLALLLLDRWRTQISRVTLRALADAALLSPILVLPFVR